jgi:hypothetical protein
MNTRVCSICKQSWPIEYFNFKAKATGRRDTRCTPCKATLAREWRAAHPERIETTNRRYRTAHSDAGRNTEENTAYFREYRRRKKEEAARAAAVLANLVSALSGSIAVPEWRGEVRKVTVK